MNVFGLDDKMPQLIESRGIYMLAMNEPQMHWRLNNLALGKNLIMTNMTSYDWWGSHLQLLFPFSWFIVAYKFVIYIFYE